MTPTISQTWVSQTKANNSIPQERNNAEHSCESPLAVPGPVILAYSLIWVEHEHLQTCNDRSWGVAGWKDRQNTHKYTDISQTLMLTDSPHYKLDRLTFVIWNEFILKRQGELEKDICQACTYMAVAFLKRNRPGLLSSPKRLLNVPTHLAYVPKIPDSTAFSIAASTTEYQEGQEWESLCTRWGIYPGHSNALTHIAMAYSQTVKSTKQTEMKTYNF